MASYSAWKCLPQHAETGDYSLVYVTSQGAHASPSHCSLLC